MGPVGKPPNKAIGLTPMNQPQSSEILRIQGGSRLHFGLFSTRIEQGPGGERVYGGLGMMIDGPSWEISAQRASLWSIEGQGCDRFGSLIRMLGADQAAFCPIAFRILRGLPEHSGLGSGTQMALGLTQLASSLSGHQMALDALCRVSNRGLRSAIGSHGFEKGGFLVDAGHLLGENTPPNPMASLGQMLLRIPFPTQWPIVLCRRTTAPGLSGNKEWKVFEALMKPNPSNVEAIRRDRLCKLALLGVLPALQSVDWQSFGEAIGDFNRLAGEPFALWQGGDHREGSEDWFGFCRENGIMGVGQSSWGPTLFAICQNQDQADFLVQAWVAKGFGTAQEIQCTQSRNSGAILEKSAPPIHSF